MGKHLERCTTEAKAFTVVRLEDETRVDSSRGRALLRLLERLEAYDPWADAAEREEHAALCAAHGWAKSRFGIYGVTPCRTVARVVERAARRGAAQGHTRVLQ